MLLVNFCFMMTKQGFSISCEEWQGVRIKKKSYGELEMKVFNNVFVLVQDITFFFLSFQSHLQGIQYNLMSQILLSLNSLTSLTIRSSVCGKHMTMKEFFFFWIMMMNELKLMMVHWLWWFWDMWWSCKPYESFNYGFSSNLNACSIIWAIHIGRLSEIHRNSAFLNFRERIFYMR
jgi:hypothetical protein